MRTLQRTISQQGVIATINEEEEEDNQNDDDDDDDDDDDGDPFEYLQDVSEEEEREVFTRMQVVPVVDPVTGKRAVSIVETDISDMKQVVLGVDMVLQ